MFGILILTSIIFLNFKTKGQLYEIEWRAIQCPTQIGSTITMETDRYLEKTDEMTRILMDQILDIKNNLHEKRQQYDRDTERLYGNVAAKLTDLAYQMNRLEASVSRLEKMLAESDLIVVNRGRN